MPQTKSFGKGEGACRSAAGLTSPSAAFAGGAARPSAESPASLAKCRRENRENIGVSVTVGVDLPDRNPVDLEGDRNRGFSVDEPHTLKIFRVHRQMTIAAANLTRPPRRL